MGQRGDLPSVGSRRACVLVVDDDDELRELITDVLETRGYRAISAANGQEALRHARVGEPDVIVLDLSMPVMDGWHFRFAQRQDPAIAAVPVIVVSALDRAAVATIDADRHLRKPFAIGELVAAVDALVSAQRVDQRGMGQPA